MNRIEIKSSTAPREGLSERFDLFVDGRLVVRNEFLQVCESVRRRFEAVPSERFSPSDVQIEVDRIACEARRRMRDEDLAVDNMLSHRHAETFQQTQGDPEWREGRAR